MDFRAELRELQQLACFLLLGVIWGCLALFGSGLSTVSAQDKRPVFHMAAAAIATSSLRQFARRRRAKGKRKLAETEIVGASYARYSSDQQREESNTDQQRKCNEL